MLFNTVCISASHSLSAVPSQSIDYHGEQAAAKQLGPRWSNVPVLSIYLQIIEQKNTSQHLPFGTLQQPDSNMKEHSSSVKLLLSCITVLGTAVGVRRPVLWQAESRVMNPQTPQHTSPRMSGIFSAVWSTVHKCVCWHTAMPISIAQTT